MTSKYLINYFPAVSRIEYRVFDITGEWSEAGYTLSINSQTRRDNNIAVTPESYSCPAFSGTKMQWENPVGNKTRSLKNGPGVSSNDIYYIGEGINENDNFIYPYEAILTYNPIAGEVIEQRSKVFTSCLDNTVIVPSFHWKYKTIAHYETWGGFADVWRTGLHEITSNHVYNYIFAKDIGMVDFWHGSIDKYNNVKGVRYFAQTP